MNRYDFDSFNECMSKHPLGDYILYEDFEIFINKLQELGYLTTKPIDQLIKEVDEADN